MKKTFTLILAAFLTSSFTLFAQVKKAANLQDLEHLSISNVGNTPSHTRNVRTDKCGFVYTMNQAAENGFNSNAYEQELKRLINVRRQMNNFGPPTVIYTLPVIFHISYDGTTESSVGTGANISQLRVQAQIEQINKDFADLSGSVYGVAEDMGVRFVAAKVDPAGNLMCEPGIERINWRSRTGWLDPSTLASTTEVSNHYTTIVKPQSIWNPYEYLNIWVGNFNESGLLGVATFPGLSTLPGLSNSETDLTAGVVVLSGSVGGLSLPGTVASYQYGRTLTHELGHFFGLRHITGDAPPAVGCGEDYCDDTPTQFQLTDGCPSTGTLNGCSPSVPMMFENYMDYTNDACTNTFTLNQSERCQVVMLNSPRRIQLATSTKGNSPVPNRVLFRTTPTSLAETATIGCPRFRDYVIAVGVDVAASGNATLSLTKSGTATEGVDYMITPASVSYTAGETGNKTFILRIFDDAIVEGSETLQIGLNIVGSGVQVVPACPTQINLAITDDDYLLEINNATPFVTLLSENFGTVTGSNQLPSGWVVSTTSANEWVGNSTDATGYGFTGNTLHISDVRTGTVADGTAPMTYSLSATTDARAYTPALPALGLRNIAVSLKLVSNGEADSDGVYDFGAIYYSVDGTNFSIARELNTNALFQGINTATPVTVYVPSTVVGTNNLRFLFRWVSDNNTGFQPPFAIDDVVITGQAITIESELNHFVNETFPTGAAASHLYSINDKQIITRLSNNTTAVNCLNAAIQSQGTSITSITTSAGTFFRSQKVISLTPDAPNSTSSFQGTFYFTTAELAAWGADVANLKLMRVNTGVNLAGTITAADAQVVSAVVSDLRTTKGYASFTGSFSGGFGQFFLVSPTTAVPVTLISFEAQAASKNILLSWTTSTEVNNRGFAIERSTNGTDFEKIGWKEGKGNSSTTTNYTYTDNYVQPGVLYYYRLRQSDIDGREKLSEIRQARIKGQSVFVTVSPNPATDILKLYTSGWTGLSNIRLFNSKGQVLQSWSNLNTSAAPKVLDISKVPAGIYLVWVQSGENVFTGKVIIQ
jgi:hypothetical protein